jgi:hypothetical protein
MARVTLDMAGFETGLKGVNMGLVQRALRKWGGPLGFKRTNVDESESRLDLERGNFNTRLMAASQLCSPLE